MGAGSGSGQQQPERRIELVDLAECGDAGRILRDARSIAEAGRAGIAGPVTIFGEAVTHCRRREAGQHTRSGTARQETGAGCTIEHLPAIEPAIEVS
jgi:hypothetical protein